MTSGKLAVNAVLAGIRCVTSTPHDALFKASSPRRIRGWRALSIASGLQRIGRANHHVGGRSRGVIIPKFRGDLLPCAAATRGGAVGARVDARGGYAGGGETLLSWPPVMSL